MKTNLENFIATKRKTKINIKSFIRNNRQIFKFTQTQNVLFCRSKVSKNTLKLIFQDDNYINVYSSNTPNAVFSFYAQYEIELLQKLNKFNLI